MDRAGYNWSPWRADTTGLGSSCYTTATSNPQAGDILNKPGHHVVTITERNGDAIKVIHANGCAYVGAPEPKNRVCIETKSLQNDYIANGYSGRTLNQH